MCPVIAPDDSGEARPTPRDLAEDHLAALMLTGEGATPDRVTLTLTGVDRLADHVVYLHEIHHRGLNDSTAWGTALQIFAELPSPRRACFLPLLDRCRLTHEAYATFASVNVASAHHSNAADLLDRYPDYVSLFRALQRLVARAGGPHREYMLATALARSRCRRQSSMCSFPRPSSLSHPRTWRRSTLQIAAADRRPRLRSRRALPYRRAPDARARRSAAVPPA